jgi:hypothetical protein
MSFRFSINPRRRLDYSEIEEEWEAGIKSHTGFRGCCMSTAELIALSGHYKNIMYEAKKRGYIDIVSWGNIKLTADNVKLQMDNDDKQVEIERLKTELSLLKRRTGEDVKSNDVMFEIQKAMLKDEQR